MIMRTLCSSIKQIKAPYMFDGEHGIALHAMHENWDSSHGEWEISWFFSICGGNLGYMLHLLWGWPLKSRV